MQQDKNMSFRDYVNEKENGNAKSHVIDLGFDDTPHVAVKKKQQQKVNNTKTETDSQYYVKGLLNEAANKKKSPPSEDASTLGDEIAENIRLAHNNINQVQQMTAKLGTKHDTHELRDKLYYLFSIQLTCKEKIDLKRLTTI